MDSALGWGALAASSLVIGALAGLVRPWPNRLVGLVLGFGAGALISAVSFELAAEGAERGGAGWLAVGLALGALVYFVLDGLIARRTGSGRGHNRRMGTSAVGPALALGAFLDGVPEQLVLGLGLATGEGVSVGLLAAIFVSNVPEAIGGATGMLAAGTRRGVVVRLWCAVAAVCAVCSVIGYAVGDGVSGDLHAGINGFAAGALLVMLVDTMVPEARRRSGRPTGLATVVGFAVAAGLSAVS
jgi:zinc transporter, ZIP family